MAYLVSFITMNKPTNGCCSSVHFLCYTHFCNLNGSWENIQVELLERYVSEGATMGIFLYSVLMFCKNDAEGTIIWLSWEHYCFFLH
jgi:hypothetical protein